MANNNRSILPNDSGDPGDLQEVTADGILERSRRIRAQVSPAPSALAQLFNSAARRQASASYEVEIAAIEVNKKMIVDLRRAVEVVVEAQITSGKLKAQSSIGKDLATKIAELEALVETLNRSRLTIFRETVAELSEISDLTDEQRQDEMKAAWNRNVRRRTRQEETVTSLIDTIEDQVRKNLVTIGTV